MKKDACIYCGKPWISHKGVAGVCEDLQACISAMKAVYTWASFDLEHAGEYKTTLTPESVQALFKRTFKKIGVMKAHE